MAHSGQSPNHSSPRWWCLDNLYIQSLPPSSFDHPDLKEGEYIDHRGVRMGPCRSIPPKLTGEELKAKQKVDAARYWEKEKSQPWNADEHDQQRWSPPSDERPPPSRPAAVPASSGAGPPKLCQLLCRNYAVPQGPWGPCTHGARCSFAHEWHQLRENSEAHLRNEKVGQQGKFSRWEGHINSGQKIPTAWNCAITVCRALEDLRHDKAIPDWVAELSLEATNQWGVNFLRTLGEFVAPLREEEHPTETGPQRALAKLVSRSPSPPRSKKRNKKQRSWSPHRSKTNSREKRRWGSRERERKKRSSKRESPEGTEAHSRSHAAPQNKRRRESGHHEDPKEEEAPSSGRAATMQQRLLAAMNGTSQPPNSRSPSPPSRGSFFCADLHTQSVRFMQMHTYEYFTKVGN